MKKQTELSCLKSHYGKKEKTHLSGKKYLCVTNVPDVQKELWQLHGKKANTQYKIFKVQFSY